MSIVSNVHRRAQASLGTLTPKCNPETHVSGWGVVEGKSPTGWHTERDFINGIERGANKEVRLQYKPTDNVQEYHGMKLREMIAPKADAIECNRIEGQASENVLRERMKAFESKSNPDAPFVAKQQRWVEEDKYEQIQHAPSQTVPTESTPKGKRTVQGWTLERRAAAAEKMRARHAAKSQLQPT